MQANKNFSEKNIVWVIRLVLLCWLITKFICFPLWMADRSFPVVPVSDVLLSIPFYFHAILFWAGIALLCVSIVYPNRKLLFLFIGIELCSCLLDQNRWQPWEYQFLFMVAAYCAFSAPKQLYTAWQLLIVGLYFFSGISKLQPAFIHDIWNSLVLRSWLGLNIDSVWLSRMGYLLPIAEVAAAVMLLFNKTKLVATYFLCAMHLVIVYLLSPLALRTNEVIIPWNILMPMMLWLLFKEHSFEPERSFCRKPFAWLLILCWCVLPWLHVVHRWDNYLSFTLYSGGTPQLYFTTDDAVVFQDFDKYKISNNSLPAAKTSISIYKWADASIHVPPYPQDRVYRKIAQRLQAQYPTAKLNFYVYTSGFKPKSYSLLR